MPAGAVLEEEVGKTSMGVAGASLTAPTELYLCLCEEEQNRTLESKTLKGELTYEGYERTKLNLTEYEWVKGTEGEPGYWTNKAAITIPANKNTTGKYVAKYWALVPAKKSSEAGKLQFYGKLEAERELVKTLSEATVPAKSLKISFE
jgi:hypothetical protein